VVSLQEPLDRGLVLRSIGSRAAEKWLRGPRRPVTVLFKICSTFDFHRCRQYRSRHGCAARPIRGDAIVLVTAGLSGKTGRTVLFRATCSSVSVPLKRKPAEGSPGSTRCTIPILVAGAGPARARPRSGLVDLATLFPPCGRGPDAVSRTSRRSRRQGHRRRDRRQPCSDRDPSKNHRRGPRWTTRPVRSAHPGIGPFGLARGAGSPPARLCIGRGASARYPVAPVRRDRRRGLAGSCSQATGWRKSPTPKKTMAVLHLRSPNRSSPAPARWRSARWAGGASDRNQLRGPIPDRQ